MASRDNLEMSCKRRWCTSSRRPRRLRRSRARLRHQRRDLPGLRRLPPGPARLGPGPGSWMAAGPLLSWVLTVRAERLAATVTSQPIALPLDLAPGARCTVVTPGSVSFTASMGSQSMTATSVETFSVIAIPDEVATFVREHGRGRLRRRGDDLGCRQGTTSGSQGGLGSTTASIFHHGRCACRC